MTPFAKLQKSIARSNMDCWLSYCQENSDPFFADYLTRGTSVPAIGLVTPSKAFIIVHELDFNNIKTSKGLTAIKYKSRLEFWNAVATCLKSLNWPQVIGLSYSSNADPSTDVLTLGSFKLLQKHLRKIYKEIRKTYRFSSAAQLFYTMSETRSVDEIAKMRLAATRAHELLESAFYEIRPGMTEFDVMHLVQAKMEAPSTSLARHKVAKETTAWEKELCPIVLAGPNLKKGGHAKPSNFKIREGHTIYFDFGVTLTFKSGDSWSSDIQRMGYVLRRNEIEAPTAVKRVFETLKTAVETGAKFLKPGIPGHKIDTVVRKIITNAGYPSYNHATGHSIGKEPHGLGAVLGQKQSKMSALKLQNNGVYTIEPRIAIDNGGSIEEMLVATDKGGMFIGPRQQDLYLIPNGR